MNGNLFDLHNNSAEVEAILSGFDPRSRFHRNKGILPSSGGGGGVKQMNGGTSNHLPPPSMRSIVGCDRSMGK